VALLAHQIDIVIPIRTYSGLNDRVHWRTKARRARNERSSAFMFFPAGMVSELPFVVTMIRRSPGTLDDDNLRGSLKAIRDGIADKIGIKDNDPRVSWRYGQERSKTFSVLASVTRA